jgi:predicted transcriptional regulator of viral defense system
MENALYHSRECAIFLLERAFHYLSSRNMKKDTQKRPFLEQILRSPQTIFSTKDVSLLWREDDMAVVANRLKQYARTGALLRVRRGLYAKDATYNKSELATRVYTPSYVSFETVLSHTGITFQFYTTIFVASYLTREITVDTQTIQYIHMKEYVLRDTTGIEQTQGYAVATKERAFLDRLYVSHDYHFDNLSGLDWDAVFAIVPIYHNKRLECAVNMYYNAQK